MMTESTRYGSHSKLILSLEVRFPVTRPNDHADWLVLLKYTSSKTGQVLLETQYTRGLWYAVFVEHVTAFEHEQSLIAC